MRSRHSLFLHGEVDCEPREENEKFETHIENETERDEIMEKEELRRKNWENERRIRDLETRLGRIEGNRF